MRGALNLRLTCRARPLPQASGEIWKLDRHTSAGHRNLAQWTRHAPGRGIVNIDVRLKTLPHALHQAVTQQIIHASMSAEFPRHLALVLPKRRLILLPILIERRPRVTTRFSLDKNTRWIVA